MLQHVLLALQVAFAWYFALSACTALVFVAVRPLARAWLCSRPASIGPLTLRLLPAVLATAIVVAVVLPAFAWLEPFGSAVRGERLGLTGLGLACGGAALLVISIGRGLHAVLVSRRRMRGLIATASPLPIRSGTVPMFVSESSAPCVVLDGLAKPRLFVSRSVLDCLTPAEFDRAAAHELAHHHAQDNLKRRLLAFAPDLVSGSQLARELEAAWRQAAELEADAAAARGQEADALALASALVKVARLAEGRPSVDCGRAAFHDSAPVAERIRKLCSGTPGAARTDARTEGVLAAATLSLFMGGLTNAPAVLTAAHRVTEWLVHLP